MSSDTLTPSERFAAFRRQMPVAQKWAYFDHAAVAPLPAPAHEAIRRWVDQAAAEGDTVWPAWHQQVEQTRTLAARLLNADADEVALVHSTSEGIGLVAEGFPWRAGDNLVTLDNEFPSNQYPWLNLASRGVETRRVPPDERGRVDLDRMADACDARTRLVSLSWVGYASGWRVDLAAAAEMAHSRGALLFVDAIQGLGVFPLDVKATGVDFVAADGHKWLLGPEGAGLFYVRREHLDRLRPLGVGWHSVVHAADYNRIELELKPSAARYEGGSQNMVGFIGLAESLALLLELGTQAVAERILEITDLACQRLEAAGAVLYTAREGEHRSGIVACEFPGQDSLAIKQRLFRQGVAASARAGRLRIAAHAYNNADDVERLVAGV